MPSDYSPDRHRRRVRGYEFEEHVQWEQLIEGMDPAALPTRPASSSLAPGREYLPWPADGFESLIIRRWRRAIERRHAAAEGVGHV